LRPFELRLFVAKIENGAPLSGFIRRLFLSLLAADCRDQGVKDP
jgi:hypothetical protein